MTGMKAYYTSRLLLSLAFTMLLATTGMPVLTASVIGIVLIGLFVLAPRSGRYSVHPEFGVTALRRDERSEAINEKSARNSLVLTAIAAAILTAYFVSVGATTVPIIALKALPWIAVVSYYASDIWIRVAQR